jgi:hydroxymethylglutaryl-CoA reductase (NADPH)
MLSHPDYTEKLDVFLKVKPVDEEVMLMVNNIASMCEPRLASAYAKYKNRLGFINCHSRELKIYQITDQRFTKHVPKVYGVHENPEREAYI